MNQEKNIGSGKLNSDHGQVNGSEWGRKNLVFEFGTGSRWGSKLGYSESAKWGSGEGSNV